jgi:NitT/TauT family transport system substrate-binding protein
MRLKHLLDKSLRHAAAGALVLAVAGSGAAAAQTPEHVKFNLSWLPQGSTVGVIVAQDNGLYAKAGLDVEIVRGYGGIRTTNEIDQGLWEFGYGNPIGVVLNRAKDGHTLMIGAVNDKWPGGLCYVEGKHSIKTPADLQGLTVGGGQYSPVQVMLGPWLEGNGVDSKAVKLIQLDPAVVDASLIEGKIDLAECWPGSNYELLEKRAKEANVKLGLLEYSKFKLDIYGSGIVTSEKVVKEQPDMVRRFVTATYEGYEWSFKHPEEATAVMLKVYPVLDHDVTLEQIKNTDTLMQGPDTAKHGLGWMSEARMKNTLDFVVKAYDVKEPVAVGDIYTNEFLKK